MAVHMLVERGCIESSAFSSGQDTAPKLTFNEAPCGLPPQPGPEVKRRVERLGVFDCCRRQGSARQELGPA